MADGPLCLELVITLPEGTLLQYGNSSRESFYFYDANHNLKLDPADKKVTEKAGEKNQFEFQVLRIGKAEAQRFGVEAETMLNQVRKERNELRKTLPTANRGQCVAPLGKGQGIIMDEQGTEFSFRPAFSLRTPRADPEKFYSLLELMSRSKKNPLDPSRCFMARALVTREKVAGLFLSSKEIEMSSGDLLSPLVLRALGLENDERQDAAYQIVQGAKRVHIDLTPASSQRVAGRK